MHAQNPSAATPADVSQQVLQWQQKRLANLTAPGGWLSLIGLEWLNEGANRVGSAADNDIVLKAGPAHLGVVTLSEEGAVHIVLDDASGATIDGKPVREADLVDDMHANDASPATSWPLARPISSSSIAMGARRCASRTVRPRRARISSASIIFPSIRRGASLPIGCHSTRRMNLKMGSVLGTINKEKVPGKAVFHHDGHTYELLPIQEEPDSLFFVIADRTSGQ